MDTKTERKENKDQMNIRIENFLDNKVYDVLRKGTHPSKKEAEVLIKNFVEELD